jgi:hypothetical protein
MSRVILRQQFRGLSAVLVVAVGTLSAPAASQTSVEPSPDVQVLAQQMPECKEFRNDCQVCVRLADGKLGCSNIGIACSPSGHWRCSAPTKTEERAK